MTSDDLWLLPTRKPKGLVIPCQKGGALLHQGLSLKFILLYNILFYNVFKISPLLTSKNMAILPLTITHLQTKYEIHLSFLPRDILLTRFSGSDPRWPKWPLTLTQKQLGSSSHQKASTYHVWNLCKLPTMNYHVNDVFRVWPLVTPNDLWPPPKAIATVLPS